MWQATGHLQGENPVFDDLSLLGTANGKIYMWNFGAAWGANNIGKILTYDTATGTVTEIAAVTGLVSWRSAPDYANNRIYIAGERVDTATQYRMMAGFIDLTNDTVTTYVRADTGDCNEIIGFCLDAANGRLILGERSSGGDVTGSSYPNGHGIWTVPLATISNPAGWVRVHELPLTGTVSDIIPYRGKIVLGQSGKIKTADPSNLAVWTDTTIDAANMIYSAYHDMIFVQDYSGPHAALQRWDGLAWARTEYPEINNYMGTFADGGNGRFIGWAASAYGPVYRTNIYSFDPISGGAVELVAGNLFHYVSMPSRNHVVMVNDDYYYCQANPGWLMKLQAI
ncbi:MAG: hypothetical protein ACYCZF_13780 [Anaerolineae bacterium]